MSAKLPTKNSPSSVWQHDVPHPFIYSVVGVFAFLLCMILLGAIATRADTDSNNGITTQLKELRISTAFLTDRVVSLEERMNALSNNMTKDAFLSADCPTLTSALPNPENIQIIPSSVACFEAPDISLTETVFTNASAIYQYTDDQGDVQELNLQIYDMVGNTEAVDSFIHEGSYLSIDKNAVTRENAEIADLRGSFTYEGQRINDHFYTHGAYWLTFNERFGILAHGMPATDVDARKLRELIEAVDLSVILGIE